MDVYGIAISLAGAASAGLALFNANLLLRGRRPSRRSVRGLGAALATFLGTSVVGAAAEVDSSSDGSIDVSASAEAEIDELPHESISRSDRSIASPVDAGATQADDDFAVPMRGVEALLSANEARHEGGRKRKRGGKKNRRRRG